MTEEPDGIVELEDGRTHRLFLGKRWGDKAEENVEKWGNQYPATVLLAMAEELGEIADAMLHQTEIGDLSSREARRGRNLLRDVAGVGFRTRAYLEETFEDPAGDPETEPSIDGRDIAGPMSNAALVMGENSDLAPLVWQLHWSLQQFESAEEVPFERVPGGIIADEAGPSVRNDKRWVYRDFNDAFTTARKTNLQTTFDLGGDRDD